MQNQYQLCHPKNHQIFKIHSYLTQKALTKAYLQHDSNKSVGISSKSELLQKWLNLHCNRVWYGVNLVLTCIRLLWSKYEKHWSYSCVKISKQTQHLWQNRQKYPILAQSQSIFYVHHAIMMVDHSTQHEQGPLIHLRYITTNIQNIWNNEHKDYNLAQCQGIFYMHQAPIVVDCCTKP